MKTRFPKPSSWITRIVLIALFGRLGLLLCIELFAGFPLIPDEGQYDIAARAVVNGEASTFWGQYGKDFLWTMSTFMKPLSAAYWIYSDPIMGRFLSLAYSLVSITLLYKSLRLLVPENYARFGTLIYLVIPSINLWAVTVMRESQIHMLLNLSLFLTIKIYSSAAVGEWTKVAWYGLFLSLAFCLLGFSRVQTLIPLSAFGGFALLLGLILRSRSGIQTASFCLLSLLVATISSGVGPFGFDLVRGSIPQLGQIQAQSSVEAESGLVSGREVSQETAVEPPYEATSVEAESGLVSGREVSQETAVEPPYEATSGPMQIIERSRVNEIVYKGKAYEVDNSWSHQISVFPSRLLASTFRPFFWESSGTLESRFAGIENVFWIMSIPTLLLFLIFGGLRRRNGVILLLAVSVLFAFLSSFALTQGNLGTVFRHRGQLYGSCIVGISVVASHFRLTELRKKLFSDGSQVSGDQTK